MALWSAQRQGQKYSINELRTLSFPEPPWNFCGGSNGKPMFNSFSDRIVCLKGRQTIHSFIPSLLHSFHTSQLAHQWSYLFTGVTCIIPRYHGHTEPTALSIRQWPGHYVQGVFFISRSQVCVTYYQTRMTMLDCSGGVSRSIQCQLVKLTGSVHVQDPPFPVLKPSFWQRHDFRTTPGIACTRPHSVA